MTRTGETVAEVIARHNAKHPVCTLCQMRHAGAAWTPGAGWHDAKPRTNKEA